MKTLLILLATLTTVAFPNAQAEQAKALPKKLQAYKKAAEQGDAESAYYLAICFRRGDGVAANDAEAVKWYRKAAEHGHAAAQYGLGYCYQYGQGTEANGAEMEKWYRKAAEQGHLQAQVALAVCYERGQGVAQNLTEAARLNQSLGKPLPMSSAIQNNSTASIATVPVARIQAGNFTAVDMVAERGVLKVPVQINGTITLKFIVDSGASEVLIPRDVFLTLIRAETIKLEDYRPGKTFALADGTKVKSDRFILRSMKVGNSTISDVEASIGGLDASLLLGQSFLSKFSEWKIDNKKTQLILEK